jgi:hypothetical protein
MTTIKASSLAALLAASSALAQSAPVGSLQGSVTDPQGQPIAGAQVAYRRRFNAIAIGNGVMPAPGEAQAFGTTVTGADGAYLAPGLPVGPYMLCVNVPSAPYVDPCAWQQPFSATVSANQTTPQTLVLTKGVYLKVRINDPLGLLPQVEDGAWTPRKLIVGVKYAEGAYQGAENTAVDSAGRDYRLVLPTGQAFWLWLFSRDVALADSRGAAVDTSGSLIPFQPVAGQDQVFTFTVSGPARQAP